MRNASTRLPEQGTQTPSPAPDLIPAKTKQELTLGLVQRTGARQVNLVAAFRADGEEGGVYLLRGEFRAAGHASILRLRSFPT